jgi:hypothetical protein
MALWHGVCAKETLFNMFFDYVDSLTLDSASIPGDSTYPYVYKGFSSRRFNLHTSSPFHPSVQPMLILEKRKKMIERVIKQSATPTITEKEKA